MIRNNWSVLMTEMMKTKKPGPAMVTTQACWLRFQGDEEGFKKLVEECISGDSSSMMTPYNQACLLSVIERTSDALEILKGYILTLSEWEASQIDIRQDPDLRNIMNEYPDEFNKCVEDIEAKGKETDYFEKWSREIDCEISSILNRSEIV